MNGWVSNLDTKNDGLNGWYYGYGLEQLQHGQSQRCQNLGNDTIDIIDH